jgi:hypothetical protein
LYTVNVCKWPYILHTGLIDEIISKDWNITYGELCDAIHQVYIFFSISTCLYSGCSCWLYSTFQHFRDSRKSNGGDSVYRSYVDAINDCLRKRREWAHLVDQASKVSYGLHHCLSFYLVALSCME